MENLGEKSNGPPFHHPMLPGDIRMLIVGQSGCGKTNLVVNLTLEYIKWTRLYIITNTPDQKLYDLLRGIPKLKVKGYVHFITPDQLRDNHEIFDDMPPLSLVIFDDFMLEKDQSFPSMVFSQGRHKKINSVYIAQFTETNLVIRQNANVLVMFILDSKSKECVHSMYASADMEVSDFKKIKLVNRDFLALMPFTNSISKKYIKNFKTYLF